MTLPQAPSCRHWRDCGIRGGGCCALARYGGKPSWGTCAKCRDRSFRGLGDVLAWLLSKLWITRVVERVKRGKCGGCAKRQAWLNARFPT